MVMRPIGDENLWQYSLTKAAMFGAAEPETIPVKKPRVAVAPKDQSAAESVGVRDEA